ncbi:MAG: DegT/DnrJ/EryC1/StrS family aminotransferase [Nitrospinota bacterium]
MRVPLLDLTEQYRALEGELSEALQRVLTSQQFILGPEVEGLEQEVARYCGARHGVGVSSGTDALLLSLQALGVGPGHEVVTPAFSFFATAEAILRVGARPVFADIEPGTFNLDPEKAARAVGPKTRALLPVHLFGQCAALGPLSELARAHGLFLIEDAAQATGAEGEGGRAGSVGDAGCLSFYPTKNLGGWGEGGMVLVREAPLAERLRRLRDHGAGEPYTHQEVGGNFRLDALQAAILRVKLRHLDDWIASRIERARRYGELLEEEGLAGREVRPPALSAGRHVFHLYVIRAQRRDALREPLAARGIQTGVYYPLPLHLQPCLASLSYFPGDFPESERASREVLALPLYAELPEEAQRCVVRAIRDFYHRG